MNLLDKILTVKRNEIALKRKQLPIDQLIQSEFFDRPVKSLKTAIKEGSGVIAEYKRSSPSAGNIQSKRLSDVLEFYQGKQVSAYSILTDHDFFKGEIEDLLQAKKQTNGVILRKEFIIDEYQIFEAKSFGADAILLIAEALDEYHAKHLTTIAHSIGLEVLMEFHSKDELVKMNDDVDVLGINNRNLKTLETKLDTSEKLIKFLPHDRIKITESGIQQKEDIEHLYSLGFDGCLIGESILKHPQKLDEIVAAAIQHKIVHYEA